MRRMRWVVAVMLVALGLVLTQLAWSQAVVDEDVVGQAADEARQKVVLVDPAAERRIASAAADCRRSCSREAAAG